jgi:RND family efflux transporter MFP subunit
MNVTVGNLVNGGAGQVTALTTIVSIDPLYCYVNVPESTALRYQELAVKEQKDNVAGANVACSLQLENETNFPHQGVIDFVDNQVDVNTGTQQIRCVIANPTTVLTPGLFALTRIPASRRYNTLLIPDAAVNTDQDERYLLIVGANNVVQQRPVKLGAVFGNLRSITEGLKPGEWVIVDGMQFAQSGAKVIPHEVALSTASLDASDSVTAAPPVRQAPPDMRTAYRSDSPPSKERQ